MTALQEPSRPSERSRRSDPGPGTSTGPSTGTSTGPSTSAGADPVRWRDPKRYLWFLGLVVPLLPFGAYGLVDATGWSGFWWLGPIWIFVLMPLLDTIGGVDTANPPESAVARLEADRLYRWATYLFVPIQYASLVWGAWAVTHLDLRWWDQLGLALTVGTVSGIAIATAHELGHKPVRFERRLAKVALAPSLYGHFVVEHNWGHHLRVSTPEDPASARLGESFWAFLPRTVVGGLRSGWRIQAEAMRRRGLPVWSPRNDLLIAWALSAVLFAALIVAFGVGVVPFLAVQAVFGFSLLEVVNYVEHYGLLRRRRPDGRYERCLPEHSWNANNVASNVVLYHLERHSDHHAFPTRRYQALRHFDDAPQLPSGYALMIGLAYVVPLWRRVMDPRVVAHYDGDVTRANIHPPARTRVLARFGAGPEAGPAVSSPAP
ncbi:MAG: alkane 1-monooxygenase [Acidimicrobiia bacterium]|nr:alkane 1-monooxygenase [Acidimicrobiia bacterium]